MSRAHAVGGTHAGLNNARVPGTVSVYLLGPRATSTPPYPTQASLDAVASHLSTKVSPGVEVVAAAPHFHEVSVRATLVVAANADFGEVLRATLRQQGELGAACRGHTLHAPGEDTAREGVHAQFHGRRRSARRLQRLHATAEQPVVAAAA